MEIHDSSYNFLRQKLNFKRKPKSQIQNQSLSSLQNIFCSQEHAKKQQMSQQFKENERKGLKIKSEDKKQIQILDAIDHTSDDESTCSTKISDQINSLSLKQPLPLINKQQQLEYIKQKLSLLSKSKLINLFNKLNISCQIGDIQLFSSTKIRNMILYQPNQSSQKQLIDCKQRTSSKSNKQLLTTQSFKEQKITPKVEIGMLELSDRHLDVNSTQYVEYEDNICGITKIYISSMSSVCSINSYKLPASEDYQNVDQCKRNFFISIQKYPEKIQKSFITIQDELSKKGYFLEKYLAKGGEGILFEGLGRQNKQVVFKILFNADQNEIREECEIMQQFDNTINVIQLFEAINISDDIFVLILEKCKSSLNEELKLYQDGQKFFKVKRFFLMILDLLDGLIQFRIFKVLHLDIKPGNILIKENETLTITDFGLSIYSGNCNIKGYTKKYAPREVLEQNNLVSYKSDIYSLGITIQYMLEIFKRIHISYDFIKQFEEQILAKMIKENIKERENCTYCYYNLIQLMINVSSCHKILFYYSKKMELILKLEQFPFDQQKDIPFFLEYQIQFYEIFISIIKLQIDDLKISFQDKTKTLQIKLCLALNKCGNLYTVIGDSVNALKCQLDSLKMRKELFKENHPDIAQSLNDTGNCYLSIGDSENALKFQFNSLKMRKQLFITDHPDIATSLNSIGQGYRDIGDSENALRYQQDSLKMRQELFKGNHPDIANSLNSVGEGFRDKDDYENAFRYQLDSLKMRQELFKGNHPDIATSLNSVGRCYQDMGDSENALRYQLDSLKMRQQLFRENRPDIATSLNNVGLCKRDMGDSENVLRYLLDSLKMRKELFLGNHSDVAQSLLNLGLHYLNSGDYQRAFPFVIESLQMRDQLFRRIHKEKVQSLNYLGLCFYLYDDPAIALNYFFESLEIMKQIFKRQHPDIATNMHYIGLCYSKQGDSDHALNYLLESLKMRKEIFKVNNHPDIIQSIKCLQQYSNNEVVTRSIINFTSQN